MKNLMMLYGVTLGKRYTKRQKEYFKAEIKETYTGLGYPVRMQEGKNCSLAGGNMLAGDFSRSEVVFVAAYDTPARSIWPGIKYYPFHAEKNIREEKLNLVLRLIILSVLSLMVYLSLRLYYREKNFLLIFTALLCVIGALAVVRTGANPLNFNLNSASLAVMGAVARNLNGNQGAAFVFLDHTAESYEGLKALKAVPGAEDKIMIILNCLASGEKLIVAHGEGAKGMASQLRQAAQKTGIELTDKEYNKEKAEGNVLAFGEHMLYVVSGTVEKKEFTVKNVKTKKDIQVDIKRLENMAQAFTDFIDMKH